MGGFNFNSPIAIEVEDDRVGFGTLECRLAGYCCHVRFGLGVVSAALFRNATRVSKFLTAPRGVRDRHATFHAGPSARSADPAVTVRDLATGHARKLRSNAPERSSEPNLPGPSIS